MNDVLRATLLDEAATGVLPEHSETVALARSTGSSSLAPLLDALQGAPAEALLALETLRIVHRVQYEQVTPVRRARIYAQALRDASLLNAWGVPGGSLTSTTRAAIDLGSAGLAAFRPLLTDRSPAVIFGSQDATLNDDLGNRVCDYAYVVVAGQLGCDVDYDPEPAVRDEAIAQLLDRVTDEDPPGLVD